MFDGYLIKPPQGHFKAAAKARQNGTINGCKDDHCKKDAVDRQSPSINEPFVNV